MPFTERVDGSSTSGAGIVAFSPWCMCAPHSMMPPVCGIAGLFAKAPSFERELGDRLAGMLEQLADRGPDSTGVALYRDPVRSGSKLSLMAHGAIAWPALAERLAASFGTTRVLADHGDHAIIAVPAAAADARTWLGEHELDVAVL